MKLERVCVSTAFIRWGGPTAIEFWPRAYPSMHRCRLPHTIGPMRDRYASTRRTLRFVRRVVLRQRVYNAINFTTLLIRPRSAPLYLVQNWDTPRIHVAVGEPMVVDVTK